MKRILTSLCGSLLIGSFIFTTVVEQSTSAQSFVKTQLDNGFDGTMLSLNIVFLLAFLASILRSIQEEDNNEKKNYPLL